MKLIGAAFILICSAICSGAFALLSYGTGWSDNAEFIVIWLIATVFGVAAWIIPDS